MKKKLKIFTYVDLEIFHGITRMVMDLQQVKLKMVQSLEKVQYLKIRHQLLSRWLVLQTLKLVKSGQVLSFLKTTMANFQTLITER